MTPPERNITVGPFRLDVIAEFGGPRMRPEEMFPALTPERWTAIRPSLPAAAYDDASGRIVTSVHSWLVRGEGLTIVVDCGSGNGKNRPLFPMFHRLATDWLDQLAALGVRPDDVTHVVNTHLHHDHVGWNTRQDGEDWVPTFTRARYLFPRLEADAGGGIFPAWNGEAFEDSVAPVLAAGLVDKVDPPHRIAPGLTLRPVPGHSPGMMILEVADGAGGGAMLSGDPMHHCLQVFAPDLNTRFCQAPEQAAATRRALLERAADQGFALGCTHFLAPRLLRVRRAGTGFAFA